MKGYCPQCGRVATDEECPHWDYEQDPRLFCDPRITDNDEARNRALQVQAHVERAMRGDPEQDAANFAPLRSIERARRYHDLMRALAAYGHRRGSPPAPLTRAHCAPHIHQEKDHDRNHATV